MSNKVWPLQNFFFERSCLNFMFQLRISTENPLFHQKHATLPTFRLCVLPAPLNLFYGCQNLFIYLDYPETTVPSCTFAIVFRNRTLTKTTSKYFSGLKDPFKDKNMNWKSNYKLKSMSIATVDTIFGNEKIIRIY